MKKAMSLTVQNTAINLKRIDSADFLSLTDIARAKNPDEPKDAVKSWLRSRQTIDFLGLWEQINNPDFKGVEFDSFKNQAGSNSFTLSLSKWIKSTKAIGLVNKAGRYGGTFAHPAQVNFTYADEADLLNLALFGQTAKQWRELNSDKEGNLRDYPSVEELVILSNMESYNAEMIKQSLPPKQRLLQLNEMAISQMNSLMKHELNLKKLKIEN